MANTSPLDQWLAGKDEYVSFVDLADETVDLQKGVMVVLEKRRRVHETLEIGKSVFPRSWKLVRAHLDKVEKVLGTLKQKLDDDDRKKLADAKLIAPPAWSFPLYFISISKPGINDPKVEELSQKLIAKEGAFAKIIPKADETLVYIGQKAKGDRFRGGHAAITKLTDPQYDGFEKWIYEARVTIQTKKGKRLPLEWVQDQKEAKLLLHSIEHQLIYVLAPKLNDKGVKKLLGKWQMNTALLNFTKVSSLLHGTYCFWGVDIDPALIPKIEIV